MGNIMITKYCNANCRYCFANKYVNKDKSEYEITEENFIKALNFVLTEPMIRVGIIGGEPTTHSNFKGLMEIALRDKRVSRITVFTNGINLTEYMDILSHHKVGLLVNYNPVSVIGEYNFNKMYEGVKRLCNERIVYDKVSLGVNLEDGVDYTYAIESCLEFKQDSIRVGICVPNNDNTRGMNIVEYYEGKKKSYLEFARLCKKFGIKPRLDCNTFPVCSLTCEEYNEIYGDIGNKDNHNNRVGVCSPVIDITPDLKAVRCFGVSVDSSVDISLFKNIRDLRTYFELRYDDIARISTVSEMCGECIAKTRYKCMGGCLSLQLNKINNIRKVVGVNV